MKPNGDKPHLIVTTGKLVSIIITGSNGTSKSKSTPYKFRFISILQR